MEKFYTCLDVSVRYAVPIETVWLWIRKKKLPAIKIGKAYRIKQIDLEMFEESRKTVKGGAHESIINAPAHSRQA